LWYFIAIYLKHIFSARLTTLKHAIANLSPLCLSVCLSVHPSVRLSNRHTPDTPKRFKTLIYDRAMFVVSWRQVS